MKTAILLCTVALLAGAGGWWSGTRYSAVSHDHKAAPSAPGILYYQSPMHPWVKSSEPGKCTVCGMELVPVYAGGEHQPSAASDLVLLPEGSPQVTGVRTVEVKRQSLVRTLRVAGIVDDNDAKHRILSAYSPGRIEKLNVNFEGAEVEAGQPLATFYSKELLAAANEYRAIARQVTPPVRAAAESRLRQLGLSTEQIAGLLERKEGELFFEIPAPLTGTVVKRYVYEGQYVQEGEKLFELSDFSTMWFQFIAYEQDLPFLREGLPVTITTPSLPGRTIQAKITFINPSLDDPTRSARVRVEFQNPTREGGGLHRTHEVLHKTYGEATVNLDAPEVIAVPRQAVIWTGNNPRVYVEQGTGAYQQRAVILGRAGDDSWEVLEGLQAGERVVASGNMLLDGQAQLNNVGIPPTPAAEPPRAARTLSAADLPIADQYLRAVAMAAEALAADDLAAYSTAISHLPAAPAGLPEIRPATPGDLASARKAFLPLSQQAAEFAQSVRAQFPRLKVFRCPMSDQVGEGAPVNARWIQFTADLRNPYMGQEMLRCGAEVK